MLPPKFTHVVEFRDPTWYVDAVFDALTARGVSLCLHDMEGAATGLRLVGPAVYLRFHGPAKYRGRYPTRRAGHVGRMVRGAAVRGRAGIRLFQQRYRGPRAPGQRSVSVRCVQASRTH